MIWFRRTLVIPLAIVFLVVFLTGMVVQRINGTLLDADFYAKHLRKADVYTFVLNDLLTSGIDEARAKDTPGGFNENPLDGLNLSTQKLVDSANRAIPPEWLQEQVEQILDQVFGYFTGGRDNFQITIEAKDRATELVEVTKDLFIESDTYNVFLDEVVTPEV
ncbi:MAG: hypothetical protein V3U79_04625, partial [Dehalococcoidia bacterium]